MANAYALSQIKNIAILGHQGAGKTSILESMLFASKKISAKGKIDSGSTVSDYTKEEKDSKMSIYSSVCSVEKDNNKINFLDTPGFFDFVGEVLSPLSVASAALVVVRPRSVEVGTKRAYKFIKDFKKPCIVVVNKVDKDNVDVEKTFASLQDLFNGKCVMVNEPNAVSGGFTAVVDKIDEKIDELTEKVANCDDEIMMKQLMLMKLKMA